MFVYNIKINGSKTFRYFFIGIVLFVILLVGFVSSKLFHGASHSFENSSCLPQNKVSKLSNTNYTSVLKTVHEHIDDYVGVSIHYTGYVYRVFDLTENQFILARNMIISSDFQSVVVGFLCEYEQAKEFSDECWVELTGTITKGNYHGDMPVIQVTDMKKVDKPNDEFVYPPDESYIPTNGLL